MAQAALITTGDVVDHCHVTYKTVQNWIRNGDLKAARTPGGHNRITVADFEEFLSRYALPSFSREPPPLKRVLIVDDDEAVLKTTTGMVQKIGDYDIATVANGFQAGIQLLKFRPDVVILDLLIPELNGFQVSRTAKKMPETRDATIIVATALPSGEAMSEAFESGADFYLEKPFKLQELKDCIVETSRQRLPVVRAG